MKLSFFDLVKRDYPRTWWMFFIPAVVLYGGLLVILVAWCNYRADVNDLEAREAVVQQQQEEALRVERYKARMAAQQKQRQSYDVRNAVDK